MTAMALQPRMKASSAAVVLSADQPGKAPMATGATSAAPGGWLIGAGGFTQPASNATAMPAAAA